MRTDHRAYVSQHVQAQGAPSGRVWRDRVGSVRDNRPAPRCAVGVAPTRHTLRLRGWDVYVPPSFNVLHTRYLHRDPAENSSRNNSNSQSEFESQVLLVDHFLSRSSFDWAMTMTVSVRLSLQSLQRRCVSERIRELWLWIALDTSCVGCHVD